MTRFIRTIRRASRALAHWACVLLAVVAFGTGHTHAHPSAAPANGHHARGDNADEYALKAAFLYNFARYTKWPDEAFEDEFSPIVIAVIGKDPFGNKLEKTLSRKKIKNRRIVIRRLAPADEISGAHVLVLGAQSAKERKACLEKIKGSPTLVVADKGGVKSSGAAIGFYVDGARVRFEISPKRLEAARLKVSSRILKLAKIVKTK